MSFTDSAKAWSCEVDRGECSLCGEVDSVLTTGAGVSLCERCTMAAGIAWRKVLGEVPPGFPEGEASRVDLVQVLVASRVRLSGTGLGPRPQPDGQVASPREVPSSYTFLTVEGPGGGYRVLPSVLVAPGQSVRGAACRALCQVGITTWPALCETLNVGYSQRGRLVATVLTRGYAVGLVPPAGPGPAQASEWRRWPLTSHAGKAAGSYAFMESAWPLRLYRHCVPGDRLPSEVSVELREVGRQFLNLQSAVDAGGDVDSSMLAVYRAAMSPDEVAVAEIVSKFDAEERRRSSGRLLPAATVAEESVESPGPSGGESHPGGEGEYYDEDTADSGLGLDDPEPGFARGKRR